MMYSPKSNFTDESASVAVLAERIGKDAETCRVADDDVAKGVNADVVVDDVAATAIATKAVNV
jgi:hypothetical protein